MKQHCFVHETAVIDQGCEIAEGTKIRHFSHIMPNSKLGKKCNIGQNMVVSPEVVLGNNAKVQNNVSIHIGVTCDNDVFLGPSMVFTNVINPKSAINKRGQYDNIRATGARTYRSIKIGEEEFEFMGFLQSCTLKAMSIFWKAKALKPERLENPFKLFTIFATLIKKSSKSPDFIF